MAGVSVFYELALVLVIHDGSVIIDEDAFGGAVEYEKPAPAGASTKSTLACAVQEYGFDRAVTFASAFGQTWFISLFAVFIKDQHGLSDGSWGSRTNGERCAPRKANSASVVHISPPGSTSARVGSV